MEKTGLYAAGGHLMAMLAATRGRWSPPKQETAVSWEARDLNLSKECARRRRQMERRAAKESPCQTS